MRENKVYIEMALNTLKEQRKRIYEDSINKNCDLYCGLHRGKNKNLTKMSIEKYITIWLDEHWNLLISKLDKKEYLREKEKKECISFFANYFYDLISEQDNAAIRKNFKLQHFILLQKKEVLTEFIKFGDKSGQRYRELKLDDLRHDELYNKEIEKLERI